MWSRGEIRPPLEPLYAPGQASELNRQDLPPSPLFPRKELLGSRHHSTFSPPVASVCTPKYKRKIREAVPFVTPVTGVPRTPSIWTQMTDRQQQQQQQNSSSAAHHMMMSMNQKNGGPSGQQQPAESARSASKVTKVHIQAMRRGSGDPRRVEDINQLSYLEDEETRSPDRLITAGLCASVVRGADNLTPNLPLKTPYPIIGTSASAGRLHRRASTGLKGAAMDLSMSSRDHDSSIDLTTPERPPIGTTAANTVFEETLSSMSNQAPEDATERYHAALLDAEALIDMQIANGEITDSLRKELDIPTNLPRFLPQQNIMTFEEEPGTEAEQQEHDPAAGLNFTEFATLFLTANGMPLLQRQLSDGTHKISLYTGDCKKMFEEREREFNASFDRTRGEATAFSKAALWFSRNTMCQRCDTQLTSSFAKFGEIPIQTQLLNHMKGGAKRRDAVSNCYKSIDNLHQKCDQSKYDEKRRIQNLMRRLAENIIAVFISSILPNYDHPDLKEIKTCLEELYFDEQSLSWCVTMSFKYSGVVYGCFWDWLEIHDLLPKHHSTSGGHHSTSTGHHPSPGCLVETMKSALQTIRIVPSELSDTDIIEVLECISLTTSDRQLNAFINVNNNDAPGSSITIMTLTRDQFVESLKRVPFNHPDFQLMDPEMTSHTTHTPTHTLTHISSPLMSSPSSLGERNITSPEMLNLIESQPPLECIEDFMQELLNVADLITKTILNDLNPDSAELDLVKKRVLKTYNSPGTATQCQRKLNIRSGDFITQDFLASFIVSYEEIQIMLAAHLEEKALILCQPNFPSIKVINLAMQLMITCVTLSMTPSERYALRNPMGPLAVNVDETSLIERARFLTIPLPPENDHREDGGGFVKRKASPKSTTAGNAAAGASAACAAVSEDDDASSSSSSARGHRPTPPLPHSLRLPKNYKVVIESLEEADHRLQQQRADSLARLVDGPKLKQTGGGDLTALSWCSRPNLEFDVQSDDDDLSNDKQLIQAQILPDTIANLHTENAKKLFVILNSAECLIETARILLSGVKSYPVPAVQLDNPLLKAKDPAKWKEFWEQHSKLAERINVTSGCLRWTSLLLILNVFDQIRPFIFSDS